MYKVLICGDRSWDDYETIENAILDLITTHGRSHILVIEGGAPGADQMAGMIAHNLSIHVAEVKALWSTRHRGAGPQRNQAMLELDPDEVIAFHNDIRNSRGTKDMINRAKKAGIPFRVQVSAP